MLRTGQVTSEYDLYRWYSQIRCNNSFQMVYYIYCELQAHVLLQVHGFLHCLILMASVIVHSQVCACLLGGQQWKPLILGNG